MSPQVDPVPSSPVLPARADVVVIGGGIAGVATAWTLAGRGVSVVLCEKGVVAGEQSSRNWGWCRAMGRDTREVPLILESLRIWRGLEAEIGAPVGFRTCGILYLCETEAALRACDAYLGKAREYRIDSRMLTAAEVKALMPGLDRPVRGGLYTPTDARAEPSMAVPALARAFQARGGTLVTGCAVRAVERSAGRISGVVTEKGRIACGSVVLAGGAWSRLFAGNLGIELPQLRVRASVLRTQPLEGAPEISTGGNGFAFRKRADGGYTVAPGGESTAPITPDSFRLFRPFLPALRSEWRHMRLRLGRPFLDAWREERHWADDAVTPMERTRILDPAPDDALLDRALQRLRAAHPAFAGVREAQRWAGLIDVTPDAVPVISAVDAVPGFFIATGFSGHGFGLGPGAGRLMADLVTGEPPVVDPAPFRFGRFSDGSSITIEAGF